MVISQQAEGTSLGTAFCVKSDSRRSYFLTNHHVVGDAPSVRLLLDGRQSLEAGNVIALGDGRRDLAVVVIDVPNVQPLTLATDKAVEGESVAVAGFPSIQFRLAESGLGLAPSMHVGTVNALVGDGFYIEYDAQTDHGNSGGPLYDVSTARVFGVVTYGIESTSSHAVQNNLAIAVPYARDVLSDALQSPIRIATHPRSSAGTSTGDGRDAAMGTDSPLTPANVLPLLRSTSALIVSSAPDGATAYVIVPDTPARGTANSARTWTGRLADGRWVEIIPLDSGGSTGVGYALMWVWSNGVAQFVGEIPAENNGYGHLNMFIQNGEIHVTWPTYAPSDGSCCPSLIRSKILTLDGIRLRPLSDQTVRQ